MAAAPSHRWQFSRLGGFDQVRLESAQDLLHLHELDQKLWAALACPVKGLELDERTLAFVDSDHDGRVRAPEVLEAIRWATDHLRDLASLDQGGDTVALADISDRTESGKAVLASARQILKDLGRPNAAAISLADVLDVEKALVQTRFNGDGVVPVEAADDEATRKAIEDVIACLGPVVDRSGKPGVDQPRVDAFFDQAAAVRAWAAQFDADPALRPLGEATPAAADALRTVRAKVDDWFARRRLAVFDARALAAVNRDEEDYVALAAKDFSASAQEAAGFPLARVDAGVDLPLRVGINPAWADAVDRLRADVVAPLLGDRASLSAADWASICGRFAAYETWRAQKPATSIEKLDLPRIRELADGGARQAITALVAADKALEKEFLAVGEVERLVRYHRDLRRLLLNFVNFADFYSKDRHATFQAGVLYLDARACELCVRVDDPAKHAALAGMARAYLAYCDCTRLGEKMTIAAAFTAGDSDNLMVGRNGVFYDRRGRDWDATITKVVENPISVRQAFWSPYKKLVRMIEEYAAKRAAAAHAESDASVTSAAEMTVHADRTAAQAQQQQSKKIDVGTVAALGVAVGAIGAAVTGLAGYLTGVFGLPFWKVCIALAGVLLLISGPAMLIAWLKLRQRNLGPILDANGWAVNGRVKLSVKFGGTLTSTAELPPGALPAAADPFAERRSPWPRVALAIVAVGFTYSLLNTMGFIHEWTKPGTLFHDRVGISLGEDPKAEAEKKAPDEKPK
jgi:hypothetical protein